MHSFDALRASGRCVAAVIALIGTVAAPASAQVALPNIVEQFQEIQHSGAGLAFLLGVGDDPERWSSAEFWYCKHYQGLARMDVDGIPYFFLTRNGNHSGTCGGDPDTPGELLVVELPSRDDSGERLRSNRLAIGTTQGATLPSSEDAGVAHIHFSTRFDVMGVRFGTPGWTHPGGVQLVDGVLVIPMKFYCSAGFFGHTTNGILYGVGAYECQGMADPPAAGLVFVDVSEPLSPSILKDVDLLALHPGAGDGYGSVAAVREPNGTYLFATMKGAHDDLDFWRSTTTDLRDPALSVEWVGSWDPDDLVPGTDPETAGWWNWEMINFVRDADGGLYLIAGETQGGAEPVLNGADWIRLFRVTEPEPGQFSLELAGQDRASSERQLETEYPQMGSLDAAGGAYVSPTGQLIFYTGNHREYEENGTRYVPMGEYRNMDVHVSITEAGLPPRLEVIDVDGDGKTETSCSGWAELYEDADGWNANGGPHRGEKLDYRDRNLENWSNLHGDIFFGDETSALRWNLPPGQQLSVFWDAGFGGARLDFDGTGSHGNLGSVGWNDRISSVHLTALADAGWAYYGSVGSPIPLTQANPCYGDADLGDMSFEWAMAASGDACVPASAPPCSLVNPGDVEPQVTCSEPGAYPIRLRVTDSYGAYTDVLDDCAYLYVPEPARATLLASGISGLLLLALLRRGRERGAARS